MIAVKLIRVWTTFDSSWYRLKRAANPIKIQKISGYPSFYNQQTLAKVQSAEKLVRFEVSFAI
jgi:hypothetical protein